MVKVSIVTPVYNSQHFLSKCISSVQSQTVKDWEHILIDDCSSDQSAAIINELAVGDSRIRYFRLARNSGPGTARNKAIEMARGRYIAFLDSDDLWHPQKLERQLTFMELNRYPFTFTAYSKINEEGDDLNIMVRAREHVTYELALLKNPIGCLTAMYDVDFFGKQYMPSILKRQDYALWLRLLKTSDAHGLNEVLAYYRVRQQSVSSFKIGLLKYEWQIYRNEEKLAFHKSVYYLFSAVLIKLKSYF